MPRRQGVSHSQLGAFLHPSQLQSMGTVAGTSAFMEA